MHRHFREVKAWSRNCKMVFIVFLMLKVTKSNSNKLTIKKLTLTHIIEKFRIQIMLSEFTL